MECLKTIGITCATIAIYHFLARRKIMRKFGAIHRILKSNIRTQSYIVDRLEHLEDVYFEHMRNDSDDSDSEDEDEDVTLPESSAIKEV